MQAGGHATRLRRLAADVAQTLRADPYSGAAFVFRSKRGDYVKILTGTAPACVFSPGVWRKGGSFGRRSLRALHLTSAQLALLIEGIGWRRTVAPEATERPTFL